MTVIMLVVMAMLMSVVMSTFLFRCVVVVTAADLKAWNWLLYLNCCVVDRVLISEDGSSLSECFMRL
jgi:hypothetical protein